MKKGLKIQKNQGIYLVKRGGFFQFILILRDDLKFSSRGFFCDWDVLVFASFDLGFTAAALLFSLTKQKGLFNRDLKLGKIAAELLFKCCYIFIENFLPLGR